MSDTKNKKHKKTRRKWQRYLPLAFLIVLGSNAALIFTQVRPVFRDPVAMPKKSTPLKLGGRELTNEKVTDEEFRRLARDTDRQQLDRLKAKKLSRKTFQPSDQSSRYLRDRIDEMEHQLRTSFSESDVKSKGSVAYALQKEIETNASRHAPVGRHD